MIGTQIHMVGINPERHFKMVKFWMVLFVLCLSLDVHSKSVSNELQLPPELTEKDFHILYNKIPLTEKGVLFMVEYNSTEPKKHKEKKQMAIDIMTGEKKEVLVTGFEPDKKYGVSFWFIDTECNLNRAYIFVLDKYEWVLDDTITEFSSIN